MQTITLSESAVAVLRFRIKGYKVLTRARDLEAYRELVDAGIMESRFGSNDEFDFTEEGMLRREEILRESEDRIERERYEPPDASNLSEAARELLRACIGGETPDGDESNRPAYRELVKARIMISLGSFTRGDECVFRFTYLGWEKRLELLGRARPDAE